MTLAELQGLIDSKQFHHATHRHNNGLWSGLWIYRISECMAGFEPVGCFNDRSGDAAVNALAYDLVKHTGVSVGSRGNG